MHIDNELAESGYEVLIVGAGFSGICMAIQLQRAGIESFVILEKANEVGGTWRDNTYPGCACDVQSHLYSFSFEGNPDWSRAYSGWQEIGAYIRHCTDKYRLRPRIRFGHEMTSATFDAQRGVWIVHTAGGRVFAAKVLVLGTGPLHHPHIPPLPGLDRFKGKLLHSARWDHDYSLAGKSVVSIGTGASAIQYLPRIAPLAKHLHVFQRTPAWVLPRNDRPYTAFEKTLFKKLPPLRRLHRARLYWSNEIRILGMWHSAIARVVAAAAKRFIRKQVQDPALAAKLTPDYTIGCKRILISDEYYQTFNRSNVELVTDGIQEIREDCIVTQDGRKRAADVIVLGTGFAADPRDYLRDCPITGLDGRTLMETWKLGAQAHLGMTVPGFPNFFQTVGPNTGLGHSSVIFMIESQVRYILDCVLRLKRHKLKYLDLKPQALADFSQRIQRRLQHTVWTSGCKSWYQQADGRNFAIWPGTTFGYRALTRQVVAEHFHWEPESVEQSAAPVSMKFS
ncbi:MAG: 4-hydroxyacetophenone monooxygenase [Burkholderiales bacterium RIFCSPLOWO2_02_FULL_57_36]|nr:MAG: 4-hydroxyacetophenone monooxygenase [Burkholderiales bacterium RIFCSPLOWO2_02_FULL_57_36]